MNGAFYRALTPWLAFAVADRSAGLRPEDAALVAAVVAIAICLDQLRLRKLHALSIFSAFVFAAFAIIMSMTGHPRLFERYDRAILVAALAVYLLGSLLRTPVTLTYASDGLAPHYPSNSWSRHHTSLTLQWSFAVTAIALSFTIGAILQGQVTATVFNWFVPIALVVAVISRPKELAPSPDEETNFVLGALESFSSHPAIGSSRTEIPSARPHLHLLPHPSQHRQPQRLDP